MKESHRKGLANHPDPESCVAVVRRAIEALTGAHAGRVLSCEIIRPPGCRRCPNAEGNIVTRRYRECVATLRSRRPRHAWKLHAREPGDPVIARAAGAAGRSEKAMSHKPDMHVLGSRTVA